MLCVLRSTCLTLFHSSSAISKFSLCKYSCSRFVYQLHSFGQQLHHWTLLGITQMERPQMPYPRYLQPGGQICATKHTEESWHCSGSTCHFSAWSHVCLETSSLLQHEPNPGTWCRTCYWPCRPGPQAAALALLPLPPVPHQCPHLLAVAFYLKKIISSVSLSYILGNRNYYSSLFAAEIRSCGELCSGRRLCKGKKVNQDQAIEYALSHCIW